MMINKCLKEYILLFFVFWKIILHNILIYSN